MSFPGESEGKSDELQVDRRWPFSWGPFTLSGIVELSCDEAEVEVSREGASLSVTVGCRAREQGLATTVDLHADGQTEKRVVA